MKFIGIKREENFVLLRYNTTYSADWEAVLDFMQVFLDDISEDVQLAQYIPAAGEEGVSVNTIIEGLLYKTEEFAKETGGISLAGKSKSMDGTLFRITMYNQSNIVDIQVPLINEKIIKAFEEDDRVFDKYMDSVEINGSCRRARRNGIKMCDRFFKSQNFEKKDKEDYANRFKERCIYLGIEPFDNL